MPYLLSEQSAEWLRAQKSRAGDLRSRRREFRQNGGAAPDSPHSPHLILRIQRLSPAPLMPSGAWTLDGAAVPRGNVALPRILAIATNLAMPEAVDDATVDTLCIGHRVAGFAADIVEDS